MIWYCVTSMYGDDDVAATVTGTLDAPEKPANGLKMLEDRLVWVDWFPDQAEAELFVKSMIIDEDE